MLVTEPLDRHAEGLALGRVTLLGLCAKVPASEAADARPSSPRSLAPTALRYVGGFGRMSWVGAVDYALAEPDPLAGAAADILSHMNDDHGDALLAYAKGLLLVPEASAVTMTAVDRYGFDMAITTPKGPKAARLAFDEPLATTDEVGQAMVALVKKARAGD